ncbi:aconitase family protein [Streptomyces sp. NPDC058155]|uniref:aconitase family protein n=1 Tax=Streptomyces sp. NPDC058155 TaxID=3346359 RepID=UPI0036E8CF16
MATTVTVVIGGTAHEVSDGTVAITAITSCTNTSNPAVMVGAGLPARNAVRAGLRSKPWVKTTLSPGSRVAMDYYRRAGLLPDLETLGFHLAGSGGDRGSDGREHRRDDVHRRLRGRLRCGARWPTSGSAIKWSLEPVAAGPSASSPTATKARSTTRRPPTARQAFRYPRGTSKTRPKGPALLGVRVVIAQSLERIHRSNLIAMGVAPGTPRRWPRRRCAHRSRRDHRHRAGSPRRRAHPGHGVLSDGRAFTARVRPDTPREADYFRHGGVMPYVLRGPLATCCGTPMPRSCRKPEGLS